MTSDDDAALQKSAAVPMPTARLRFFALAFAALIAVTVAASWAWAKGRIYRAEEALHTELERLRSDERANAEQASTRLQQTAKQRRAQYLFDQQQKVARDRLKDGKKKVGSSGRWVHTLQ